MTRLLSQLPFDEPYLSLTNVVLTNSFSLLYIATVKYLAAYLLLVNAGKTAPSAADVTSVLSSVGIEVESDKLDKLISELEGKSVEELIAEGTEKMASAPGAAAAPASGAGASTESAAAEEVEEEKEESDDDMGFGLFD